ncbi:hypothetical protein [Saccharopolyspora sp. NPDC049357]|uniref:hypothetical protein n=1 Tax=Saccharopolyspora sp. NPDC049357 TaxID=3154507 RepID=UPI00341D4DEE
MEWAALGGARHLRRAAAQESVLLVAVEGGPSTARHRFEQVGISMDRGCAPTSACAPACPVCSVSDIVPGLLPAHQGVT